MLSISKTNFTSITQKLVLLYLLNVLDMLMTNNLLDTRLFMEANPIMAPLINSNQNLGLFVKLTIPFILISVVTYRLKSASEKQMKIANILITISLIVYGMINILHVANLLIFVL